MGASKCLLIVRSSHKQWRRGKLRRVFLKEKQSAQNDPAICRAPNRRVILLSPPDHQEWGSGGRKMKRAGVDIRWRRLGAPTLEAWAHAADCRVWRRQEAASHEPRLAREGLVYCAHARRCGGARGAEAHGAGARPGSWGWVMVFTLWRLSAEADLP